MTFSFHPSSFIPHPSELVSSVRQHRLDALLIGSRYQTVNIKQSLPLVGFLGQDVTRVRMAALDLSSRGQAKTFRRTFMCF